MSIVLSKSSDFVICTLYREFLRRRKDHVALSDALYFGDADYFQPALFPRWSVDDLSTVCAWLASKGLLKCSGSGDGVVVDVALAESGLIYMENRFSNQLDRVREWLETLGNLLPF